jgi:hypothetical protein
MSRRVVFEDVLLGCLDCGAGPFPMVVDLDCPEECPSCGAGHALVWWDAEVSA